MTNHKLTFFSFVAILSSIRQPSRGPLAPVSVNALSPIGHSENHSQRTRLGAVTGFSPTTNHASTSSLRMATSSSDLKNDIEQTKNLATIENESQIIKKQKEANKTLEDLGKKQEKRFEGISNNVVSRLARAAKEAAVAKKKKKTVSATKDNKKARLGMHVSYIADSSDESSFTENMFEDDEDTSENLSDLSSITKLNSVIDQELLRPNDGYKPARETDSIRVLLEHNNNQKQDTGRPTFNKSIISPSSAFSSKLHSKGKNSDTNLTPKDVAIVFGRPLGDGQITIEYAVRLVSLAKAMKFEGYKPNLICFCGPVSTPTNSQTANTTMTKNRSVTSIGVEFFRKLCADNDISLEGIDLCRVPSLSTTRSYSHKESHDDGYSNKHASSFSFSSSWSIFSLSPVVKKLLGKHYLEKWLEESEAYESDMDEYGMTRQEPRKKIHIHWKLFSTEYHLCNLNDIHIRSPRQSPLARLTHDLEHAANGEDYRRGIIQTTWSFHYSIYPYVVSSNKQKMKEAFLGKCYLMAQSLVPLLVNLKGVAENSEFFQRDNYRTLVATRRSLATLLEQMNEAYRNNRERQISTIVIPPTLKAQLKKQTSGSSTTISSIEIHLECALLSLGRCCDLVRPAGTFSEQSVSRQEWKDALLHLQEFMNRIECSCDPDRPVPADKWDGKLTENRPVMEFLL